jgi:hypothetical protein
MANISELSPPPDVNHATRAMEIARVWIVDKKQQVVLSGNLWEDPAAWGLMLVDLARHVANAYEDQGRNKDQVLARIREAFAAEWGAPTDNAERRS